MDNQQEQVLDSSREQKHFAMFSCRSGLRFESHSGKKKKNQHRLVLVLLLARPEGLEPPTFWFVARHSIQLS